ncbi:hypothetical protein ACFWN1_04810 [Streptomyces sp. NPDC058459]|uniref:hypothetical protein n=1 Tax=Streptomyces sp. NPDC058459 TaxID=3346508 RepID=UPI00364C2172
MTLSGYHASPRPGVEEEWAGRFGGWLRSGAIRFPVTPVSGIGRAPEAWAGLVAGQYAGTVVVELPRG